ncbi:FAD-binding oxidoreductase [Pseudidiomarina sp. 1APP75-32.1]|uniref:FAD-binding oxidoreductase n=1 Tax=Pseudidiomarina terrestris TaxID=2820060 RepID=A0AAW7QW12_9GAMM|nr:MULTISPECIES: FAD-dependent oxidoreductase [unclassified Pseudidiomarina]MDN7124387.1 FAD-binding oxidoreductase [Pseudidiomarina sp. 1APP75-32.1]MDN7129322.1 FAD-binding oxidoreductase [Pseudidiomarina sp. 1APR75-15]
MYDPLVDNCPGPAQPHARSYWQATTKTQLPKPSAILPERTNCIVIGAGYTGLNAALELAKRFGQKVVLIDANRIGWGCSTRNAGFAMPGTGRLGYGDWQKRLGDAGARAIQAEYQRGFDRLERHLELCPQQLQVQRGGYLKVAHQPSAVEGLRNSYQTLKEFDPNTRWLDSDAIQARIRSPQAHAAIHFPQSFGINPVLLTASIARQASEAGVTLVEDAPVQHWDKVGGLHRLHTAKGRVCAPNIIIATNGYTPNHLHPSIHGRTLPVLSSVIVTRPLHAEERQAIGLSSSELVMDTRTLKYYYRLLPDGRLLFGGRGAIRGKDAGHPRYARHLLQALRGSFPALRELTSEPADYYWSGWVSVALDDYPRVYSPEEGVYTSMGYCGAGVTFTQIAGQRLAELVMGEELPPLPFYQSPLPEFPFPHFRRVGQWAFYQLARWRSL